MGETGSSRRVAARLLNPSEAAPPPGRLVYGRRRSRSRRPEQTRLIGGLLPHYAGSIPESGHLDPATLFGAAPRRVWLEIGFGGGEHLAFQAAEHPEIGLIGCEVFENGIVKLLARIERRRLANIRVFADDARFLIDALPLASIDRVFLLFPDPWPKRRHHKRRILSRETLDGLAGIMTDNAELRLATDDADYLCWMLEKVTGHPNFEWLARQPGDWRERPPGWPATRYEEKARAAGKTPIFVRARRQPRIFG